MVTASKTKLRPDIHYLDLIAKIQSHNGTVSKLTVSDNKDQLIVKFQHSYPNCDVIFREELIYNNNLEILKWTITNKFKSVVIFDNLETTRSELN